MERKVSLSLYATAFAISLAIFIAGVFVGTVLDSASTQTIAGDISGVSERLSSVQLLLLMEADSASFCPVYVSELEAIDEEVESFGYRLSFLEEEKNIFDPELKKQYFVLEAESYLLSQKVNSLCGDDSVLLIHFYSNKDCADCREQGAEILRSRDLVPEKLKLFSFDGDIGSPVAEAFMGMYGVSTYPSVVIDGRHYAGFRTAEELAQLISNASESQ